MDVPPRVLRLGVVLPQGVTNELARVDPKDHRSVLRRFVQEVEAAGFDSVWVSDHFHRIRSGDAGGNHEGWTLLSAAAQWTERVELGQLVMNVGFRNPALLAKMAASLDVLSGGRVVLGLGAGWHEDEYRGYGFPFDPPAERIARLGEAATVIRAMLDGARPTFSGRYCSTIAAQCEPGPLRRTPLLIGGQGAATLRLAARHADLVNLTGDVPAVTAGLDRLERACGAVGRDPATVRRTWMTLGVVVRETDAEVHRAVGTLAPVARQRLQVAGTPPQVAEQLAAYAALGCEELMLTFSEAPDLRPLQLFAAAVVPHLRAAHP